MILIVDLLVGAHEPAVEPVAVSRGVAVVPLAVKLNVIPVVGRSLVRISLDYHVLYAGNIQQRLYCIYGRIAVSDPLRISVICSLSPGTALYP